MGDEHDQPSAAPEFETDTPSAQPGPDQPQTIAQPTDYVPPQDTNNLRGVPGYDIIGELGRGGMGVVYKARQLTLNRIVALKMVLSGVYAADVERRRFVNEARSIAAFKHPNIVQVFDSGEYHGHLFYAMELLEGGSLSERLGNQQQPPTESAELVEVLARAVQQLHAAGVVHRDLKPANIFLTSTGTPKIGDFGLAKQNQTDVTATRAVMGSPGYMAPEQAEGRIKDVGPAADVHALGAILYKLLTGRPPFEGTTISETLEQVRLCEPASPRRFVVAIPRDLETVCMKCLRKDPGQRYSSAEALAHDLRRFLTGEPVHARRVSRLNRLWRRLRRNPLPVSFTLVVVILLGLLVHSALKPPSTAQFADDSNEKMLQTVAELDRLEPGWRLEQIEAGRETLPDAENSALQVQTVRRLLPSNWLGDEHSKAWSDVQDLPPNEPFGDQQIAALRGAMNRLAPAVAEGLKLAERPRGRYPIVWSRDGFSTQLQHAQDCRSVAKLMGMTAVHRNLSGNPDGAVVACQAALNTGRSLGTEPLFISQLVRQSCVFQSARDLERVLAHGEASDKVLAVIQSVFEDEAKHPALQIGARGDRGGEHWTMVALEAGDIRPEKFKVGDGDATAGPMTMAALRRAHIWLLNDTTRFVHFTQRPDHEIATEYQQWAKAARDAPPEVRQLDMLLGLDRLILTYLRTRATVLSAAAAVAAERYRRQHGRWPNDMSELVGQYLGSVPIDPYDGQPLRLRRLADGLVIYAIGIDRTDNQGLLDYRNPEHEGTDVGFRLWDMERRAIMR